MANNLPIGNELIPNDNDNILRKDCFKDVVSQHVNKHFHNNHKLPISTHPIIGHNLPKSYVDYIQGILSALQPVGLVSSNTGSMIIDIFRDMVGGGYVSLDVDKNDVEKDISIRTTKLINQLLKNTETFGQSSITRIGEEVFIRNATEFYYDKTNNIYYSSQNFVLNNEDGVLHEMRYIKKIKGQHIVVVEQWFNTTKLKNVRLTPNFNSSSKLGQMLVAILTNNPYNEDWIGISAIDSVQDQLKGFELTIQEYNKALYFTSPTTFIHTSAIDVDDEGNPNIDLTNDVYVPVDGISIDNPTKLVETNQYKFDAESFRTKINDDLNIILSKVGLDQKVIAMSGSNIERSATEIQSEDNRMYATIENRRASYHSQLQEIVNLINIDFQQINIRFIPIQSFNMNLITNVVVSKYGTGLISLEHAIKDLNPRFNEDQLKVEVERIKEESKEKQNLLMGTSGGLPHSGTNQEIGIDNNAENKDKDGYNTQKRVGVRRGKYNT